MGIIQFGEKVRGYEIPVLNEREIRAAAGILFVLMLVAVMMVIFRWNFGLLRFATTLFLIDIVVRLFVSPRFAPTLILGRLIVRNQNPEYVGAAQKRFAWLIGLVLALTMFVTMVLMNVHSPLNGIICMICVIFLFFEAAFGICLGCMVYPWIYGKKAQYCPGEVCEPKNRQSIQKTSLAQVLVLVVFLAFASGLSQMFFAPGTPEPKLLWGMQKPN